MKTEYGFLFGPDIQKSIVQAASCSTNIVLISGFIKSGFLERVGVPRRAKLNVYARWRLFDLAAAASDLNVYKEVREHGGDFYINRRLHAKTFIFDETVFTGSANLTSSGLSKTEYLGNLENIFRFPMSLVVSDFVSQLTQESILVTDEIYQQICLEVESVRDKFDLVDFDKSERMPKAFEDAAQSVLFLGLTVDELPWCSTPRAVSEGTGDQADFIHDRDLYGCGAHLTTADLKMGFLNSRAYHWLVRAVSESSNFGSLSAKLHTELSKRDPVYRSRVKELLENMLNWCKEFDPNMVEKRHKITASYTHKRRL